jgi:hypothetical protein
MKNIKLFRNIKYNFNSFKKNFFGKILKKEKILELKCKKNNNFIIWKFLISDNKKLFEIFFFNAMGLNINIYGKIIDNKVFFFRNNLIMFGSLKKIYEFEKNFKKF